MRKTFKLKDILTGDDEFLPTSGDISLQTIANHYGLTEREWIRSDSPEVEKLLKDYVFPRFYDSVALVTYEEIENWEVEKMKRFLFVISWIIRSKDVHESVIEALNNLDLMADVGNVSENFYNDTPQAQNPHLDTHVSSYTKNVTKGNFATPIERVREIREKLRDEYEIWMKEFEDAFIIYGVEDE